MAARILGPRRRCGVLPHMWGYFLEDFWLQFQQNIAEALNSSQNKPSKCCSKAAEGRIALSPFVRNYLEGVELH